MWEVENALRETVNRGVMHDVKLLLIFCDGGCGVRMDVRKVCGCWGIYICVLSVVYIIKVNLRFAIHAIHIHKHGGLSSKCMEGIGETGGYA